MNIVLTVRKSQIHALDEKSDDLNYWLSQSPIQRLQAVTFLVSQSVDLDICKMDKSILIKKSIKA